MTFLITLLKYKEDKNGDRAMVDGINFNSKVGQIDNIKGTNTAKIQAEQTKVGAFGYGFKNSGVGFERNVVPADLLAKFENLEVPKYTKNIAQLTISDNDYIPDKTFEEPKFCEV